MDKASELLNLVESMELDEAGKFRTKGGSVSGGGKKVIRRKVVTRNIKGKQSFKKNVRRKRGLKRARRFATRPSAKRKRALSVRKRKRLGLKNIDRKKFSRKTFTV